MKTATFIAPDIECGGCVNSITRSLRQLAGVEEVTADADTKRVEVRYNEAETGEHDIRARLESIGFPTQPD
jgi:copper chaperone